MNSKRAVTALIMSLVMIGTVVVAGVSFAGPNGHGFGSGMMNAAETSPTPSVSTSATIRFTPRAINMKSHGRWIEARLRMPLGTSAADIDTSTVVISDINGVATTITPVRMRVSTDTTVAPSFLVMKFPRRDVIALLSRGKNTITMTWAMKDASLFSASDTVRVIGKKSHGHAKAKSAKSHGKSHGNGHGHGHGRR